MVMDSDLLMWKSPIRSGVILGAMNIGFLVYFFMAHSMSPLALASKGGFVLIFLGAVGKLAGAEYTQKPVPLPKEHVRGAVRRVGLMLNRAVDATQCIVLWEDQGETLKALAGCYLLSIVHRWFSVAVVAFVVGNLLFVVPVACDSQKQFISEKLQPKLKIAVAKKDELIAMIPKYTSVYREG
mmetsp:Transcript_72733/g.201684  ORF Transcript_72733/g.201684 Transcript_72733/m.201684 type:complete len:183 (-) Transcript_72733:106-654(-)